MCGNSGKAESIAAAVLATLAATRRRWCTYSRSTLENISVVRCEAANSSGGRRITIETALFVPWSPWRSRKRLALSETVFWWGPRSVRALGKWSNKLIEYHFVWWQSAGTNYDWWSSRYCVMRRMNIRSICLTEQFDKYWLEVTGNVMEDAGDSAATGWAWK